MRDVLNLFSFLPSGTSRWRPWAPVRGLYLAIVLSLALGAPRGAAAEESASKPPQPNAAVAALPPTAAAAPPTPQPTPNAQQLCETLTRQLLKVQGAQEYQCSIAQQQAQGAGQ